MSQQDRDWARKLWAVAIDVRKDAVAATAIQAPPKHVLDNGEPCTTHTAVTTYSDKSRVRGYIGE